MIPIVSLVGCNGLEVGVHEVAATVLNVIASNVNIVANDRVLLYGYEDKIFCKTERSKSK